MFRILVVDDEEKIREVIRTYAEYDGHTVVEAKDGFEAVEKCKQEDFDVIVMDIMMPRLDGFSAYKEIKKHKDIPVLMLSARGEEYDKDWHRRLRGQALFPNGAHGEAQCDRHKAHAHDGAPRAHSRGHSRRSRWARSLRRWKEDRPYTKGI